MSALISALDNFTPSQLGENGTKEYTWSNSIRERIVQLSFQLTRVRDETKVNNLAAIVDKILFDLKSSYNISTISREEYIEYMSLMYRLIGHTRDIIDGKGEYSLSYMLVSVWYNHYPELAKFAIKLFVLPPDEFTGTEFHPYGSWKDIKYFNKKYDCPELNKYANSLLIDQ